jgi:hypothetical protein
MVQFLWQEDMLSVARFVTDCFDFLRSAGSPSNQPYVAGTDVIFSLSLIVTVSEWPDLVGDGTLSDTTI